MTKLAIEGVEMWDKAEVLAYAESIGRPIKKNTLDWYINTSKLLPDARVGATALFRPETVKALLDHKQQAGRKKQAAPPRGYYSVETLATALGLAPQDVRRWLRVGAITPDYVPAKGKNKGLRFFNEDTMQAMKRGEHRLRAAWKRSDETEDETLGFDDPEV